MTDLVTYLSFDGQCEAAFKFYEGVLRGKILMMIRLADAPFDVPRTPETENRIMHARLRVGDRYLMGGDAPAQHFSKPQGFCVSFQVDDAPEAERVFSELAQGGKITMPISQTFWANRFGMLIDKFGVPWMVNCEQAAGARTG
jgi:PhnB protein